MATSIEMRIAMPLNGHGHVSFDRFIVCKLFKYTGDRIVMTQINLQSILFNNK